MLNLRSWRGLAVSAAVALAVLIVVAVVTGKGLGCPDDRTFTAVTNHGPFADLAQCDTDRKAKCVDTTTPAPNAAFSGPSPFVANGEW